MKYFPILVLLISITSASCDNSPPQVASPPPSVVPQDTLPPTIPVEFFNPFSENLEARIFDDRGWIVKVEVPAKGRRVEQVPLGLYTIGVKDPVQGEYLHFYPSGIHPDSILDLENLGVKVNAKGERDTRYRFRQVLFDQQMPSRLVFDMGLKVEHRYALSNARKYYLNTTPELEDADSSASDPMDSKVVLETFTANKPFYIPISTLNPSDPLPDEVILEDVIKDGVYKLYEIPDSIFQDSIESYVNGEILFEALVRMVEEEK